MKLQDKTILMRHNGLQKSMKKQKKSIKQKRTPKPTLSPPKCTQKRRRSENFEEKMKIFQHLEKNQHPSPTSISPLPQNPKISTLGQQKQQQQQQEESRATQKSQKSLDKSSLEARNSLPPRKIASILQPRDRMNKNLEASNIAPLTPPPKETFFPVLPQLKSKTAAFPIFKIQKMGGKPPPDQSEETSKLPGPSETLIGRR